VLQQVFTKVRMQLAAGRQQAAAAQNAADRQSIQHWMYMV
jgi:hypothetical protein